MPKCALPENLDEASEWKGTDDDVWYMRWRLHVKGWFAFSNRCPKGITGTLIFFPGLYVLPISIWFTGWSWWYLWPAILIPVSRQWRKMPTVIFAAKGKGPWRIESSDGEMDAPLEFPDKKFIFYPRIETSAASTMVAFYLSRVQYWTRWHVQVSWPFLIAFHFYFKASDVPPAGQRVNTDGKLVYWYRGWHRDGDFIFWGDGGFLGTVWK